LVVDKSQLNRNKETKRNESNREIMNAANEPIFNERGLLDATIPPEAQIQQGMMQQSDQSFAQWMESRVARMSTRRYDWDALKFQADYDPKYRRAQMRYVGTGGTGVAKDSNTVPVGHFTFSTMLIPAGHEGPMHIHYDVEEIFFMLRGKMKVICERNGERWETIVNERDLISVPPGVYREEINIGDEDALMCVMLGSPKPITPVYPPDSPLAAIKRNLQK
jgi:mannose-6-phosphate isomerase-like protein (cupin superfamily)